MLPIPKYFYLFLANESHIQYLSRPIIRQGLKSLLEAKPDLEVVREAENGQQAIAQVKTLQPDAIAHRLLCSLVLFYLCQNRR